MRYPLTALFWPRRRPLRSSRFFLPLLFVPFLCQVAARFLGVRVAAVREALERHSDPNGGAHGQVREELRAMCELRHG